jgi:DNA-binding transcriptional ArsR family regulator/uncharacterized protein YndB with AHSA1/START domain
MDEVFRALADPGRRRLLDSLNARNGQNLRELCAGLDMARQSVSKHLAILEEANLVATARRGREKLHYLNAAPINDIAERWLTRFDQSPVAALSDLKRALDDSPMPTPRPEFVYTTYIHTTPERLWRALTDPAFTERYWGLAFESDWKTASPLTLRHHGISEELLARISSERRSKVAFHLEPDGARVKLTVVHDGFDSNSTGAEMVSGGWPRVLAELKTLLETGNAAPVA